MPIETRVLLDVALALAIACMVAYWLWGPSGRA